MKLYHTTASYALDVIYKHWVRLFYNKIKQLFYYEINVN